MATITGDPLVKFASQDRGIAEQRWETCKRWVAAAAGKRHNPASVSYKWRHVYREICLRVFRAAVEGKEIFDLDLARWLGMAGLGLARRAGSP